jgi:hypothetical protein
MGGAVLKLPTLKPRHVLALGVLFAAGFGLVQTAGDAWKSEAVNRLSQAGVNISFPDGAFLGEDTLTGYQAAVLFADLLNKVDAATGCPDTAAPPAFAFVDVPPDHWARPSLERVSALNVSEAFPDGNFRGDQFLTGYQTAYIAGKILETLDQKVECGVGDMRSIIAQLQNDYGTLQANLASGALQGPPGPQGLKAQLDHPAQWALLVRLGLQVLKGTAARPAQPDPQGLLAPEASQVKPALPAPPVPLVYPAGI